MGEGLGGRFHITLVNHGMEEGGGRGSGGGFTFSSALNPGNLSCKKNKPFCQE